MFLCFKRTPPAIESTTLTVNNEVITKSFLPYDVIEIILSRLPLKSLLRFKIVAKSWYAMTTDPTFARMHLDQSEKSYSDNFILWQSDDTKEYHLAKFENHNFRTISVFKFPCEEYKCSFVLCTCDGFVLLKTNKRTEEQYVLWNPITKAYTTFCIPYRFCYIWMITLGICYDRSTDDYKVVFITEKYYAVFSYKNSSWSDRKEFPYSGISQDPGIFANGVLYWISFEKNKSYRPYQYYHIRNHSGYRFFDFEYAGSRIYFDPSRVRHVYESDYSRDHEIVYFDPMDEEFKKFHKPDGVEKNYMSIKNVPKAFPYGCSLAKPLCLTNDEIVLEFYYSDRIETKFIVFNYRKKTCYIKKNYSGIQKFFHRKHSNVITCLINMVLPTRDIELVTTSLT